MSKCEYLIDISPYDPLCDHPCKMYGGGAVDAECETCQYRIEDLERENEKLQAENKNLIANYEMLSVSYMDSKRASEHLFTDLKRYKSLLRAKLPERELMLIDEIMKLRELAHKQDALTKAVHGYWAGGEGSLDEFNAMMDANAQVLALMRELGIEVPE